MTPADPAPDPAADGDRGAPRDPAESDALGVRLLVRAERVVAVVLLTALFGLVVFQVVSRYVLAAPLVWTEEIARYALIWLTFLVAPLATARRRHITARVFSRFMSVRALSVLEIAANAVVAATALVLAAVAVWFAASLAGVRSPAAGLSMAWVYGVGVPGFALVCLHALVNAVTAWRRPESLGDEDALAEGA